MRCLGRGVREAPGYLRAKRNSHPDSGERGRAGLRGGVLTAGAAWGVRCDPTHDGAARRVSTSCRDVSALSAIWACAQRRASDSCEHADAGRAVRACAREAQGRGARAFWAVAFDVVRFAGPFGRPCGRPKATRGPRGASHIERAPDTARCGRLPCNVGAAPYENVPLHADNSRAKIAPQQKPR